MRGNKFIWAVRLLQLLVGIAVLALAGVNISDYTSAICSVPTRLKYNIAAVRRIRTFDPNDSPGASC